MKRIETDVCIIGAGAIGAEFSRRLLEKKPGISISILDAGKQFSFEKRFEQRQRMMDYLENPWPEDVVLDQRPAINSEVGVLTMAVGGSALHWAGNVPRFSSVDLKLKSTYGLAVDWPIEWSDLEKYYCEAEKVIGVSGEPDLSSPDKRSAPYPMPALPLNHNLLKIKNLLGSANIESVSCPSAKNSMEYDMRGRCLRCDTCAICPTGAKYSPDFTLKRLIKAKKIVLYDEMLVRKLVLSEKNNRISAARAQSLKPGGEQFEFRAKHFIVASGYVWTPHLLLLSANDRFPNGLANKSGLVGRYLMKHHRYGAMLTISEKLYSGIQETLPIFSSQFMRSHDAANYVRHDLKAFEGFGDGMPKPKIKFGRKIMLGSEIFDDWKKRVKNSWVYFDSIYDVHADESSRIELSRDDKNRWGDPRPVVRIVPDRKSIERIPNLEKYFIKFYSDIAKSGGGNLSYINRSKSKYHSGGGCQMGAGPKDGVCDSFGRTFDHENLFTLGSSMLPTQGCTHPTLTYVALALRSAEHLATTI